jgi:ABC-2 type transport system ATP-binding protein
VDIIIAENINKRFGDKEVLKDISFSIKYKTIFGVIGPNGAGKTTLLRIIAGIITKYEGNISILGKKPIEAKREGLISYMPEDAYPYEKLTGYENLEFFAKIYSKGNEKLTKRYLENGLKIANLGDKIYEKTSTYSRGMKRRLAIARTLMVEPKLAILDEPTSALDVEAAVRIREIINEITKLYDTTVILSSHNMLEVEYLCDEVILINNGYIVTKGKPKDIIEMFNSRNLEEAFIKATKGELNAKDNIS